MKTKRLLNIVFKILVVIAILLQIPFSNFNNVYAANVSNVEEYRDEFPSGTVLGRLHELPEGKGVRG